MKLTIPYTYEESIIPYRCRKPRLATFDAEITLTVKEVAAADFPVVGILHGHYREESEYVKKAIELRKFGKRLYSKFKWPYLSEKPECIGVDELTKEIGFRSGCGYYEMRFNCGKSKARRRIMRTARQFVIFNGEVWSQCGEPMYLVQTFGLGHNHGGTSLFVQESYNPNISKSRYIPATDLSGAIDLFFKTACGRGDTKDADRMKGYLERGMFFDECDYVEVIDPTAFVANPVRDGYDGDSFMNSIESMICGTDSSAEAGLLALALLSKEMAASSTAA